MSERTTMGGKPVVWQPTKTIINFKSGFEKKLLCDGPTFTTGTACQYSCSFCFVPAAMRKLTKLTEEGHMDVVIRRQNALEVMRAQLIDRHGCCKFFTLDQIGKVIYASPLVDVAANMELVDETVAACQLILDYTEWNIRLLSKSNLLPQIAKKLGNGEAKRRVIYGVSTGTLDDDLAAAFEHGTAKVSKRIQSLHWLQDNGFRTFGMICPSLPQADYNQFAEEMAAALRPDKLEHVWAEVINVRGDSYKRTFTALWNAGFKSEAQRLVDVQPEEAWEQYARDTFLAHVGHYRPGQLRFLQYVNNGNRDFWESHVQEGAVLL